MRDIQPVSQAAAELLAAMKASNPPLEKLMADRLALRQAMQATERALGEERRRVADAQRFREVTLPRMLGTAKRITLAIAAVALAALAGALLFNLFDIRLTATFFASLLLPIWLIDQSERFVGRRNVFARDVREQADAPSRFAA